MTKKHLKIFALLFLLSNLHNISADEKLLSDLDPKINFLVSTVFVSGAITSASLAYTLKETNGFKEISKNKGRATCGLVGVIGALFLAGWTIKDFEEVIKKIKY